MLLFFYTPLSIGGTNKRHCISDYDTSGTRTTSNPNEPLVAGIVVTVYNASETIADSYTTTSAFERNPANYYSTGLKVTVAIQVCCPAPTYIPVILIRS